MAWKYSRIRFLLSFLLIGSFAMTEAQNLDEGKELFRANCQSCHNRNMKDDMTGPALGGTAESWKDYPEEDLYAWIRNSQALIQQGHPRAEELWEEYNQAVMTPFPNLSDEDIANILAYIEAVNTGEYGPAAAAGGEGGLVAVEDEGANNWLYYILFFILLGLVLVLSRILNALNNIAAAREGREPEPTRSIYSVLTSKAVVGFIIFALIILGGYTTVKNAIALNRQQGYQPEQPIKFSHETHAGLHQIDCNYCHDGARRSKHASIPSANTCMNCHRAIRKGTDFGTGEITKIYASIGYDPNNDIYIDNYEELTDEEIKKIYTTWIANEYIKDNGQLDVAGEEMMETQWENIVASLTSEDDPDIAGPIEWVRIHNLPDHVYFNHAQHVDAGKVACETCHGEVGEMELVEQYAPLSMGWCVNCHRETEVQFEENPYYRSYAKYHEQLARGVKTGVTVEEIGGTECQKCHY